ncbi:MAG: polyphosphate kinase 2 family protein [Polymorphobacter sp.]|uniref:polyphosphate kinase 2 family protein n=1 Tax=Polymorphobacter sp. TaxID=1909290 RepID=UPI003A843395
MSLRLDQFETGDEIDGDDYEPRLAALQRQLQKVQAAYIQQGRKAAIAIEGWDAAGKGGLIKRFVAPLDPRFAKVWSIAAPSKQELAHHYLWRFWQRLPAAREIAVFDRSWYGRVLVERVDGLTPGPVWKRGYDEINEFEALHAADGLRIIKIFLHTTQEEQDRRLLDRLAKPWKRWKTGLDDYHNRSQRAAYLEAYHDMFDFCSTSIAPWTVIEANDKKTARIHGLEAMIAQLETGVDLSYPDVPEAVLKVAEAALGKKARAAAASTGD